MAIPHRFPDLMDSRPDRTGINRPETQDRIQKKLNELHSCIVTGNSGVGKAREAEIAIRSLSYKTGNGNRNEPDDSLVVCTLESNWLLQSPHTLYVAVTREVMSNCAVNVKLKGESALWELADQVKSADTPSVGDVLNWFRELGTVMSDKQVRLVLWFRAFHRVWYEPDLYQEFKDTKEKEGQLASLFLLLGCIHNPAKDASQRWAMPFYTLVQARGMEDIDVRSARATSNWRPGMVTVPPFSLEQITRIVQEAWGDVLPKGKGGAGTISQIANWFLHQTGGVIQRVIATGRWVETKISKLTWDEIRNVGPAPVDEQTIFECLEDVTFELNKKYSDQDCQRDATLAIDAFRSVADLYLTEEATDQKRDNDYYLQMYTKELKEAVPDGSAELENNDIVVNFPDCKPMRFYLDLNHTMDSPWDVRCLRCCNFSELDNS